MRTWFRHFRMALLALTMAGMVGSVAIGVFYRYFLNAPLYWTDELARYSLVWMTFLGAAELFLHETGHARVSYFVDRMGARWKLVSEFFADCLILVIIALMVVGGVVWMQYSGRGVSTAMSLPMPLIYAAIPISATFAGIIVIWRMVRRIRRRDG